MKLPPILALLFFALHLAHGAEVVPLDWPTKHASSAPKISPQTDEMLPAFRTALTTLPESTMVTLALTQPAILGLTPAQAQTLAPLVAERYRLVAASPLFSRAASALPYCYQAGQPPRGWASLYVPDGASEKSPVIVFLHGYGGSFLWYQHWLSEVFPNHLILCPAYGISSAFIRSEYILESMSAASGRLGFPLQRPTLIGLSAGGFGACRVYPREAWRFSQMICLAAFPPTETTSQFPKTATVRFLSGTDESFVVSGELQRAVQLIKRTTPATELKLIPGGDHFFMLTQPRSTQETLWKWVGQ